MSKEEIKRQWEDFAEKIVKYEKGSPKLIEIIESYRNYFDVISPEAQKYWMATPTYAPGKMFTTVIPRRLMPLYLEYPEVRSRYGKLAEAYFNPPKKPSTIKSQSGSLPRIKILVCQPSFEPATSFGSGFIERYISTPYRLKYDVNSLWRLRDIRIPFASRAVNSNVICGVGHGNDGLYTGQIMQVLWKIGQYNPEEVTDKSIKLLSCLCGRMLGPDLIQKGAKLFQGYTEEYIFYLNYRYRLAPWLDPVASTFLTTYCNGVSKLLDEGTNIEAYEMEKSQLISNAEQVKDEDPEMASALYHNADNLIMLGEKDATING